MFVDVHVHLYDVLETLNFKRTAVYNMLPQLRSTYFCSSSHCSTEFTYTKNFCTEHQLNAVYSFGIHPQDPYEAELPTLENLLQTKSIQAIGEIGFDLYDKKNKSTLVMQKKLWDIQVDLAIQYDIPIVIHLRKATHLIFQDVQRLKKIKAVIFHGWSGSIREAQSLIDKKVNAFFSIGKALLRGQKSVIETARSFPLDRLLTETDAPYMRLKGEAYTSPQDIETVLYKISELRAADEYRACKETLPRVREQIKKNFFSVFPSLSLFSYGNTK